MTRPLSRRRLALAALIAIGIAAAILGLRFGTELGSLVEWVRAAGPLGFFAYGALVFIASAMMLPASLPEVAAGFR